LARSRLNKELLASHRAEIEMRFDLSLLPNTSGSSTRSVVLFRLVVTNSSSGAYSAGCDPQRPEIRGVSRRLGRFHEPGVPWRGHLTPWPHAFVRLASKHKFASDVPVARSVSPRAIARKDASIRRENEPRSLRQSSREATQSSPIRNTFVRQEMRCSSSAPSGGDCASYVLRPSPRERTLWKRSTLRRLWLP